MQSAGSCLGQWLDEKAPPAQVAEGDSTTRAGGLSVLVAEWKCITSASCNWWQSSPVQVELLHQLKEGKYHKRKVQRSGCKVQRSGRKVQGQQGCQRYTCTCIYHSQIWLCGPHSKGEPTGGNNAGGPIGSRDANLIFTDAWPPNEDDAPTFLFILILCYRCIIHDVLFNKNVYCHFSCNLQGTKGLTKKSV